jgi:hypothetical protein
VTPSHRIRLEFPVGELKVVGTDDSQVEFHIVAACDDDDARCAERANALQLESTDENDVLHLKLDHSPSSTTTACTSRANCMCRARSA